MWKAWKAGIKKAVRALAYLTTYYYHYHLNLVGGWEAAFFCFFGKPAGSSKNHVFLKVRPPRASNKTGRQKKVHFAADPRQFFF